MAMNGPCLGNVESSGTLEPKRLGFKLFRHHYLALYKLFSFPGSHFSDL